MIDVRDIKVGMWLTYTSSSRWFGHVLSVSRDVVKIHWVGEGLRCPDDEPTVHHELDRYLWVRSEPLSDSERVELALAGQVFP